MILVIFYGPDVIKCDAVKADCSLLGFCVDFCVFIFQLLCRLVIV